MGRSGSYGQTPTSPGAADPNRAASIGGWRTRCGMDAHDDGQTVNKVLPTGFKPAPA
jgi:hypothetical protein